MITKRELSSVLPIDNKNTPVKDRQNDQDIIKWVLITHDRFGSEYDLIYERFWTGNIYTTCEGIWTFLKRNFTYKAETQANQTIRRPSQILKDNPYLDCKHYSQFAAGILDSISRNESVKWRWTYRFASYDRDPTPAHVFVVVFDKGKEIWIDPCLAHFNEKKYPSYDIDSINMLSILSGPQSSGVQVSNVDVGRAWAAFLVCVNQNYFGYKDLLKANPEVTNGPVKRWVLNNDLNFESLIYILNV